MTDDKPQHTVADQLLDKCVVYRKMMATHALLRNLGFEAADLYSFVGANAGIQIKTQGMQFSLQCCDELPRPYDEFARDWGAIVEQAGSISDAMMDRCKEDWGSRSRYTAMLLALRQRGFEMPEFDAFMRDIVARHEAEFEGKLQ